MKHIVKVARLDAVSWPVVPVFGGLTLLADVLILSLTLFKVADLQIILGLIMGFTTVGMVMPFFGSQGHNLDGLFAMFNFQRREIVLGHYFYGIGFSFLTITNLIIVVGLCDVLLPDKYDFNWIIMVGLATLGFFILLIGVQYPLMIRLSYDKLPWVVMLPLAILGTLISIFRTALTSLKLSYLGLSFLGVIGLLLLSAWLSIYLYQRKEF